MPKNYAKRFAQLIASDPEAEADYAIQLYDIAFTYKVAAELEKLGFHPFVDGKGLLTLRQPGSQDDRSSGQDLKTDPPPKGGNVTRWQVLAWKSGVFAPKRTNRRTYQAPSRTSAFVRVRKQKDLALHSFEQMALLTADSGAQSL